MTKFLQVVCLTNSIEMVTFLLSQGIDVNSKDDEGRYGLHFLLLFTNCIS